MAYTTFIPMTRNEILSTRRPILLSCRRFHLKRANTEEGVKLTQIDTGWSHGETNSWKFLPVLVVCEHSKKYFSSRTFLTHAGCNNTVLQAAVDKSQS